MDISDVISVSVYLGMQLGRIHFVDSVGRHFGPEVS